MPNAAETNDYRTFELPAEERAWFRCQVFLTTVLLLVNAAGLYFTHQQNTFIRAYWKALDGNPSITAVELQDAMAPYVQESETIVDEVTGGPALLLRFPDPSYLVAYVPYSDESLPIEESLLMHAGSTPMSRDAGSWSGWELFWYLGAGIAFPIGSIALARAAMKQRDKKKRRAWVRISMMIALFPFLASLGVPLRFWLGI